MVIKTKPITIETPNMAQINARNKLVNFNKYRVTFMKMLPRSFFKKITFKLLFNINRIICQKRFGNEFMLSSNFQNFSK